MIRLGTLVEFKIAAGRQRGVVVQVLVAGDVPLKGELRARGYALPSGGIGTRPRAAVSYVVAVEQEPRSRPIAYWPKKVSEGRG